jgi:hypothetical protein
LPAVLDLLQAPIQSAHVEQKIGQLTADGCQGCANAGLRLRRGEARLGSEGPDARVRRSTVAAGSQRAVTRGVMRPSWKSADRRSAASASQGSSSGLPSAVASLRRR